MNKSTIGRRYGLIPSLPDPHNKVFGIRIMNLPPVETKLVATSPMAIDQMQVGMCTGAGTSRALKNWLDFNNYPWKFTPSALAIYAWVREEEGQPLTSDSGAAIPDVFTVLNTKGVCPEDSNPEWSWPFSASDDRWQLAPPAACEQDALKHKVIQYMKVNPDPDSIKTVINQGLPIVIGISVFQSFESDTVAQSGVIPMPGFLDNLLGGHCLRLDAYGMHDPAYADGVNSWGQEWGDTWAGFPEKGRGRFHIPFEYLCNPNLCSDIWAVQLIS